jgi:plasmid stability protein
MASMIIRNLEEHLKGRLRVRAAINGRSMEAEVREILRGVLGREHAERGNGAAVVRAPVVKAVHMKLPEIETEPVPVREPPEFD